MFELARCMADIFFSLDSARLPLYRGPRAQLRDQGL